MRECLVDPRSIDLPLQKMIKEFILMQADILRLTQVTWREGWLFKKRGALSKDKKFEETIKKLQPFFIKEEINNELYNIPQGEHERFHHNYYNISKEIAGWIREDNLLHGMNFGSSSHFYGFEDPNFYNGRIPIASIISHEQYVTLYLNGTEKIDFEKEGVVFFN